MATRILTRDLKPLVVNQLDTSSSVETIGASQPVVTGSAEGVSTFLVVLMVFVASVAAFGLCIFTLRAARKELVEYFTSAKSRLRFLRILVAVAFPLLITITFDVLDLSELVGGGSNWSEVGLACFFTAVSVIHCFVFYTLWTCEDKLEDSAENTANVIGELNRQVEYRKNELNTRRKVSDALAYIMDNRRDRIQEYLSQRSSLPLSTPVPPDELRKAMAVEDQIRDYFATLHQIIAGHFNGGLRAESTLRIVYYAPDDKYLLPVLSFDGAAHNCMVAPGNDSSKERFKCDGSVSGKAFAVWVSTHHHNRAPFMISDAMEADKEPGIPYEHLTDSHRQRAKSIAGYVCGTPGDQSTLPKPVLILDCDETGFFSESTEATESLRRILDDFSARLLYEETIRSLVNVVE